MKRPGLVLTVCALVLAGLAAVTSAWLSSTARSAMVQQVMRSESLAAGERAALISSTLDASRARLAVGAALPAVDRAVSNGEIAALRPALTEAASGIGVVRMSVTRGDEVLITVPDGTLARPEGAFGVYLAAPNDPRVVLSTPVRDAGGVVVGAINQELALTKLAPQLVQPFESHDGSTTLVSRDDTVLVSTGPTLSSHLSSPDLLQLAGSGVAGTASFHSTTLGADRIAASAPVAGYPWAVIVGADESAAGTPAGQLAHRLQGGFALAVVLAAIVLGVAALTISKSRHRLQVARSLAENAALRDGLTGLWNRRALDDLVQRLRRSNTTVGIILLDLNRLKTINDSFGHAIGDEALRLAGAAVRRAVRPDERAFRYGGDEFIVVFEGLSEDLLVAIAGRIQRSVEEEDVMGLSRLSAAIGWAVGPASEIDDLLLLADTRMYADKGRSAAATTDATSAS